MASELRPDAPARLSEKACPRCQHLDVNILSGKYTRESLKDPENRVSGFDSFPDDKMWGLKLVEKVREIATSEDS